MAFSPPSDDRRIVLRDVAKAAKVSLMTASLAVRNSPRLSAETRQKVQSIALKIGYRPDPELSRLMLRLRLSRTTRNREVIATIDLRPVDHTTLHIYDVAVRKGIARKAGELGFGVSNFRLCDYADQPDKLLRVLRYRGISGVVILPVNRPTLNLGDPSIWSGLSVVSAATCVFNPRFHQVAPNIIFNVNKVIEIIQPRAKIRIATIIGEALALRTANHYSLALSWHGHGDGILILPTTREPAAEKARIRAWLEEKKPDVILAQDADLVAEQVAKLRQKRSPVLVSLSNRSDNSFAFLDQLPDLIGESAVSQLSGMMHNNETGVPRHPLVTTVSGVFRPRGEP